MTSVFLAHHRTDRSFARRVAADLQRAGADVWLHEMHVERRDSEADLRRAIATCTCLAVVLSPPSAESKWVCQDLRQALDRPGDASRAAVWTILHRESPVPGFLGRRLSADFRDPTGYEAALESWKKSLGLGRAETRENSHATLWSVTQHAATDLAHLRHRVEHLESEHAELGAELRPLTANVGRARRAQRQQAILQEFARGGCPIRPATVFLGRVLPRLARDLEFAFRESRTSILLADAHSAPPISADPDLIDSAFFEALEGAFRCAGPGTRVGIEFECPGATVITRLRSTAVAAEPQFALDVFSGESRSRSSGGGIAPALGRPLYLAQLIVSSHGGEITNSFDASTSTNELRILLPQGAV